MKRYISIFVLLLGYLVIMSHLVIPHHHIDGNFCIVNDECESTCEDSNEMHHEHQKQHQHQDSHQLLVCELDINIVIPDNESIRPEMAVQELLYAPMLDLLLHELDYFNDQYLSSQQKLDFLFWKYQLFETDIKSFHGLRAPPSFV